jgi:hypothetical protein
MVKIEHRLRPFAVVMADADVFHPLQELMTEARDQGAAPSAAAV